MTSGAEGLGKKPIKICIAGDSGVGKSGAIVSLILNGHKLRVIDVDNGLDIILNCLHDPESPYYKIAQSLDLEESFRYETVNHKMITMDLGGDKVRIQPQSATVWPKIEKLLNSWDEACGVKLGPITSWSEDSVIVLDSSTFSGYAALSYVQQMNSKLGAEPLGNEWRRFIGAAQEKMENVLRFLYSDAVKCHVIVITHINYISESFMEDNKTGQKNRVLSSNSSDIFGSEKAFPSALGRALGPRFGRYFNNVVEMRIEGTGRNTKRLIHTTPQGAIAVKTSAPFSLKPTYDVSTGLAEIFCKLQGKPEPKELIEAIQNRTSFKKEDPKPNYTQPKQTLNPILT
jgi:hypothetical protein